MRLHTDLLPIETANRIMNTLTEKGYRADFVIEPRCKSGVGGYILLENRIAQPSGRGTILRRDMEVGNDSIAVFHVRDFNLKQEIIADIRAESDAK